MDLNSQLTFFHYLYDSRNIPLCIFQGDDLVLQLPIPIDFSRRIQKYVNLLKKQNVPITYLMTNYDAFYGLVRIEENDLWAFVGPFFTTTVTEERLADILDIIRPPADAIPDAKVFLSSVPVSTLSSYLSFLSCIHAALAHSLIPIEEINYANIYDTNGHAIIVGEAYEHPVAQVSQIYTDSRYNSEVSNSFDASLPKHTTFLHEMHRLELIAHGDVEAMKKNTETMLPGKIGQIGSDALRQAKNIFISGCTLYTRAAIAGGLDVEEAYNLSDIFINTCESYTNVMDVERLHRKMPLEFTERVELEVKLKDVSEPMIAAVHYIKEHLNQPIQSVDVAEHVGLSTSYFLKKFKAELGVGLSEYITKERIHEACSLLTYTDKSLTEISNYLYFSSQSYFQNVFKKYMNMTPNQYRNAQQLPVFMRK